MLYKKPGTSIFPSPKLFLCTSKRHLCATNFLKWLRQRNLWFVVLYKRRILFCSKKSGNIAVKNSIPLILEELLGQLIPFQSLPGLVHRYTGFMFSVMWLLPDITPSIKLQKNSGAHTHQWYSVEEILGFSGLYKTHWEMFQGYLWFWFQFDNYTWTLSLL